MTTMREVRTCAEDQFGLQGQASLERREEKTRGKRRDASIADRTLRQPKVADTAACARSA
jgi:hypothetical protein